MEQEGKKLENEQPIRILFPKLYEYIETELENLHVHPYDIQANIAEEGSEYRILIHFGDGFAHTKSQLFTLEAINQLDTQITEFIKELGEKCKEVMIADYFKMMKI
ncbi:hypothetical protein ACW2QC_02825 [Virgibacillus sp. FSP13]